jgi:hypothetical protein
MMADWDKPKHPTRYKWFLFEIHFGYGSMEYVEQGGYTLREARETLMSSYTNDVANKLEIMNVFLQLRGK